MNWDRLEGQWKQQRGKAVYHWGRMMNDELSAILGRYEERVGKLQEKYGIAKDAARHRVDEYKIIVDQLKQANGKLIKLHKALNKKRNRTSGR
ncbi:MAG: CsbD family protein [Bacteroidota bacterium]